MQMSCVMTAARSQRGLRALQPAKVTGAVPSLADFPLIWLSDVSGRQRAAACSRSHFALHA